MNAVRNTILIASFSLLGACTSGPPPAPAPKAAPARAVVHAVAPANAPGVMAPVDRWRQELAELLPSPWRFEALESQVVAPSGWTRVSGDRGLALWLTDGKGRQVFWIMPKGFEGRVVDEAIAAEPQAKSNTFVLYQSKTLAAGFTSSSEVATALGMGQSGTHSQLSRTRRRARIDMRAIGESVERFKSDMGYYPVRLEELWKAPANAEAWRGPYTTMDPQDPWGSEYDYSSTIDSFEITSYGADGAPGGIDADQDLSTGASLKK